MWPQTGAERLLYAAPAVCSAIFSDGARAPAGGEGGPPAAQQGVPVMGVGSAPPRPAPAPCLGAPWATQLSPQELSPPRCNPWPYRGRGPGAGPRALATPSPSAASPAYLLPLPQPQDVSHLPRKSQGPESRGVSQEKARQVGQLGGRKAGCRAESA